MNHRISQRKLNRTSSHRKALRRNLAQSLFEHGAVRTTLAKSKDLRPFAERLITLARHAKKGNLTARRRIHTLLTDRSIIPAEHREGYESLPNAKRRLVLAYRNGRRHRTGVAKGRLEFTAESVIHRLIDVIAPQSPRSGGGCPTRLIDVIAPQFDDRPGGYTRVIRLPRRRIGDQGPQAVVQLIGQEKSPGSISKSRKTTRRRKADVRYAAAVKASKSSGKAASRKEAKENTSHPGTDSSVETSESPNTNERS